MPHDNNINLLNQLPDNHVTGNIDLNLNHNII